MEDTVNTSLWGSNRGTLGINGRFFSKSNADGNALKNLYVKQPSRLCFFGDVYGIRIYPRTISIPPAGAELRPWHNNAATVLYYDGHVDTRRKGSFSETRDTPFWSNADACAGYPD
jgi:prepilin-type processing-associated H-X9-DG protein